MQALPKIVGWVKTNIQEHMVRGCLHRFLWKPYIWESVPIGCQMKFSIKPIKTDLKIFTIKTNIFGFHFLVKDEDCHTQCTISWGSLKYEVTLETNRRSAD